ncbi:MAG TPA: ABC transporter substrate-binding protein [Candidatus Dormibacteraeota bacterium]|nr:ABC transporter substrate-binding protein [Candidatus Dormibacteraeota bacterium]
MSRLIAVLSLAAVVLAACSASSLLDRVSTISIGAVYPLSGPQAPGGREEFGGLKAALEVARSQGVAGADRVQLTVMDAETPDQAAAAVDHLIDSDHVQVIAGTYGSNLSVAASAEAEARHVVYWETGAVADDVTNQRHWVFRTVATGSTLGRMAAQFTIQVLMPKLSLAPAATRVAIVHTNDFYGRSVSGGEAAAAAAAGIGSVTSIEYNPNTLDPAAVVAQVAAARPDFLWDVSYLDDGIAVWKAVLADGLSLKAAIGTSSAFCLPEFQARLGNQALGVYAADKPDQVISPAALTPAARTLLASAIKQFAADNHGQAMEIPGVAGFVGGWTLFHDVLGSLSGSVTSESIRAAATKVDVPVGGEINGGGVRFAPPGAPDAGQNLRAAAVVGQWQTGGVMRVLYPSAYATGAPDLAEMG